MTRPGPDFYGLISATDCGAWLLPTPAEVHHHTCGRQAGHLDETHECAICGKKWLVI